MTPRTYERIPLRLALSIAYAGIQRDDAFSRDVSLGGMFIELSDPPPYATEIAISFKGAPAAMQVRLVATVRWRNDDGMGVQLGALGAKGTWVLNQLLAGRAADAIPADDVAG